MGWPKIDDPYEIINSFIIWLTVIFVGVLIVQTSSPPSFSSFGQNQLLMLGIITLLLLFRYIKKIKIGDIIDIEFEEVQKRVNALIARTDTNNSANEFEPTNMNDIRDELLIIKGNIETIKAKAART